MKVSTIPSLIAIAIAALIAYGFYSFNDNSNKILLSLGSFLLLGITLVSIIGVRYNSYPSAVNSRSLSVVFFLLALVSHLVFSFVEFTISAYIVTHGILFLLYILLIYYVTRRRL